MKSTTIKNIFMIIICLLMISATFLYETLHQIKIKNWQLKNASQMISPMAQVGIVQSDKATAEEITEADIKAMTRKAMENCGGLDNIVKNGDMVILKPNLVFNPGTAEINGITTDWRVTKAVSELVREINPDGKIYVMEGSAGSITNQETMEGLLYTYENLPDVDSLLGFDKNSGDWKDYDSPKLQPVILPDSVQLYPDNQKPNNSAEYYLNKIYFEADVLISIPVLKDHFNAGFTGTLKNVGIGATPSNIYGKTSSDNIRNRTITHSQPELNQWIHDFNMCRPVDFTVIDGLQGFEKGPHNSNPSSKKNMRLILAGSDPVAIDAIACLIAGYDPTKIGHIAYCHNSQMGCIDASRIRVSGKWVHEVKEKFNATASVCKKAWYSDYTAPQLSMSAATISNDLLHLNLNVNSDCKKVEIEIDGALHDKIIVSDFDNIIIPVISGITLNDISVHAFDAFLNGTSLNLGATDIAEAQAGKVTDFALLQNYPNPFNPETVISLSVPERTRSGQLSDYSVAELNIYNSAGRLIKCLFSGIQTPGYHKFVWDGRDQSGTPVSSGIYICRLDAENFRLQRKMTLVR